MTVARYATRTAAFAAAYLLAVWAGLHLSAVSPIAVAAVWMLAQGRWDLRRFDVITLVTITAVAATLNGAGLLAALGVAAMVTLPALGFAMLVERWAPGWWAGHGDRFRSRWRRLGRVAGAAALTAAAFTVLQAVTLQEISRYGVLGSLLRDTVAVLALAVAGRALHRSRAPRRPAGLTLVR